MNRYFRTTLALGLLVLVSANLAWAKNRTIHLESNTPDTVSTQLTVLGGGIPDPQPTDWPQSHTMNKSKIVNGVRVYYCDFKTPDVAYKRSDGTAISTPDEVHHTDVVGDPKKVALQAESEYIDGGGQYALADNGDTLATLLGDYNEVTIPFVSMDLLGGGQECTLYNLVNLSVYADQATLPTITLGDSFNVVDGTVASLPGMQFSSTPFTFDPATGFTGTPVTGTGYCNMTLTMAAVPEPATMSLLVLGSLLLVRRARGRN